MTRIDPEQSLGVLMEAIRRRAPAVSAVAASTPVAVGAAPRQAALPLRQRLAHLLAEVDPDDEAALAAAAPGLLREVLVDQFGPGLLELAEAPSLLKRLQAELSREAYLGLWRELARSLR